MVEANSTIIPLLGPLGSLVNTIRVLVGGVFGIYLIILYLKWREYVVLKKMLTDIRKDLRVIAAHQKIEMTPIREQKLVTLGKHIKKVWGDKKKEHKKALSKK